MTTGTRHTILAPLVLAVAVQAVAQTPCAPPASPPTLLDATSAQTNFPLQIDKVVARGFMAPCGSKYFCPMEVVLREDMAVHLECSMWSTSINLRPAQAYFNDVPMTYILNPWIQTLVAHKVTVGCPYPNYCPYQPVKRQEMAAFIARAMIRRTFSQGSTIEPDPLIPVSGTVSIPGISGTYNCVAGGTSMFNDVPPTDGFCRHVHYLLANNVTRGCPFPNYCPGAGITREEMAAFICRAFDGSALCW
ncbi:MAG: S-layer homology domain-containing protein [Thermoanaerobaculaceae bacterium]